MNAAIHGKEFWRSRLFVPNYRIGEAARYAHLASQTVASWHKPSTSNQRGTLSAKDKGASLSYLQLIEVAVVASFRKAGVSLQKVRSAREYVSKQLEAEHPFAEYRFKTDGHDLWMDYAQIEADSGDKKLLLASGSGQLAWSDIIGRLKEFDYEADGLAVRWHVAGKKSGIIIDPRVQFGAPSINGVPTWVFKGRLKAGEDLEDIADDFGVTIAAVEEALRFEGMDPQSGRDLRH